MQIISDIDEGASAGVRGIVNRHAKLVLPMFVVLVAVSLFWASRPQVKQGAYFSDDDGKTFFEDAPRAVPYTRNGIEVVRAVVYSCDGGATKFVGYLIKYNDEGRAALEKNIKENRVSPVPGRMVKRPGGKSWVEADPSTSQNGSGGSKTPVNFKLTGATFADITRNVKPPAGMSGTPVVYNPPFDD